MRARPSLSRKALIAFILVALIPVLVLGGWGLASVRGVSALARQSARTALEAEFRQRFIGRVSEIARTDDTLFRTALSQAVTLGQYASLHYSQQSQRTDPPSGLASADALLEAIQQSTPGAYRAWMATRYSYRAYPDHATGQAAIAAGTGVDLPSQFLWEAPFTTWTEPYPDRNTGRLIVSVISPVYQEGRQLETITGVDMLLNNVLTSIPQSPSGSDGLPFLLDGEGRLVYADNAIWDTFQLPGVPPASPDRALGPNLSASGLQSVRDLAHTFVEAKQAGLTTVQVPSGMKYIAYAPVPITGWVVGLVIPAAEMSAGSTAVESVIRRQESLFLTGGGVGLVLLLGLGILMASRASRSLARPVAQLVEGTVRLSRELSYRLPEVELEELGRLTSAFNAMAGSLERSRDEAVRSARMVVEERNRLAREIHDTIAQGLAAVVVHLENAEDVLGPAAAPDAIHHIQQARDVARESLREARRSVWNLRPGTIAEGGLVQALATLRQGLEAEGIVCTLSVDAAVALPEAAEDALFRVCQEALANVRRHSGARHVQIRLRAEESRVALSVVDDGCGFVLTDTSGPHPTGGFGLWAMRSRLAGVGGSLEVESRPAHGTTVTAYVPIGRVELGSGD